MAAKFDRKFILILGAAGLAAIVVLGAALAILQPWGPARHLRRADAAAAEGDWRQAFTYYGRAFSKEPGNIGFLELTRDSLLKIVPETGTEAAERYQTLRTIMDRRTRVGSADPERWTDYLQFIEAEATALGNVSAWNALAEQAALMEDSFGPGDPASDLAEEFRLFALAQSLDSLRSDELETLEDDLRALVERLPTSGRGWGSLARLQVLDGIRLAGGGRRLEAAQRIAEAQETIEAAAAANASGAELLLAKLELAKFRVATEQGDPLEIDAVLEALGDEAARSDPQQVLRLARAMLGAGRPDSLAAIDRLLESQSIAAPDDLFLRQLLAFVRQGLDRDGGREIAMALIERPRLPVGLESAFQDEIALRAAAQVFDIDFGQWSTAESDEDRARCIERMSEGLDTIGALTAGAADDSLKLRCEAKLALARDNAALAASRFEEVMRRGRFNDPDTLYHAAVALQQIGELGRAYELLSLASSQRPSNTLMLSRLGEIAIQTGRNAEAEQLAARILEIDPESDLGQRLAEAAEQREGIAVGDADDPATLRLRAAESYFAVGRTAEAMQLIDEGIEMFPDDVRYLRSKAMVLLRLDQVDEAKQLVEDAIAIDPRDPTLIRMQTLLATDDPIERIRRVTEQTHEGDPGLPGYLFATFEAARREFQQRAEELLDSDPEGARRFSELAIRASEAAQEVRASFEDEQVPAVLATRFDEAIIAGDYDGALAIADEAGSLDDPILRPLLRSRVLSMQGDLEGALDEIDAAAEAGVVSSRMLRERGVLLEQMGRPIEALQAYEEALSRRPNYIDVVRRRASLLVRTGRNSEALQALRDARRIALQDREIENAWLSLEGEFGDRRLALERRAERYRFDSADTDNALGFARLLVDMTAQRVDVRDQQGRVRYGVGQWDALSPADRQAELDKIEESWRSRAAEIFTTLAAENPDDLKIATAHAEGLRTLARAEEGEQVLRSFIAAQGEAADASAWLALGTYLVESRKGQDALFAFTRAVEIEDPEKRPASLFLSDFWFRRGDWELALGHLENAPVTRGSTLRRVECLTKLERLDEAQRVLASVEDRDMTLILLEASILDAKGRSAMQSDDSAAALEAYQAFEALLSEARAASPSSPQPMIQLANSLRMRGLLSGDRLMMERAVESIDEALRLDASSWPATRLRSEVLIEMEDAQAAAAGLEEYVGRRPDFKEARQALVEAHLRADNAGRAREVVREAIARDPSDASWYQSLGELQLRNRDFEAALPSFRRSYELAPNIATLHRVVDMQLRQTSPDFEGIIEVLSGAEEDVEASVYLQSAEAVALANTGQVEAGRRELAESYRFSLEAIAAGRAEPSVLDGWFANLRFLYGPESAEEAEAFVRGAVEGPIHPIGLRWLAELAAASRSESGFARSASLLEEAIALDDESSPSVTARIHLDRGNLHYMMGDCRAAVESFERSAASGVANPQTLNNLAYLCGNCLDDPARGIPHIERALAISDRVPEFIDTYGYLLWKSGRLDEAETNLLRSLRLRPSALANYHLAEVLAAKGNPAQARTAIQQARGLSPDPELAASIDDLEQRIR